MRASFTFSYSATGACHCSAKLGETPLKGPVQTRLCKSLQPPSVTKATFYHRKNSTERGGSPGLKSREKAGRFTAPVGQIRSPMVLQSQKLSFSASFWKFCTQILARQ